MRNDLLEQIVIASGGTVTNKDDRNALLSDWLAAASNPQIEVARLDGATKYWQLTAPISLIAGDKVRLKYQADTTASTSIKTLYGRDVNFYFLTALGNNGAYAINAGAIKVDGVDYVAGNQAPIDGGIHTIEQSISASVSTSVIGAAWGSFSEKTTVWHFDSVLFDFEVERGGEIIYAIPLTNKSQGATQLATVGSVNATMINYTGDEWEPLP